MFDSLTIARRLTEVGLNREQAECVMADAIRQAAEHDDHVTPDALRAELATLRADIYHAMLVPDGRDHCWNGCSVDPSKTKRETRGIGAPFCRAGIFRAAASGAPQ